MKTVLVPLDKKSYPIHIGHKILQNLGNLYDSFRLGKQVVLIMDKVVNKLYGKKILRSFEGTDTDLTKIILPVGESVKQWSTAFDIYDKMIDNRIERTASVVAFGGGVVGDLAGFVAGTYLRGIRYIQVPTTLLAQVDSSIGGKVGINHSKGKNLIGLFYQPEFVLSDTELLVSLPTKEIISGLAEVIKYGIIWDESFFGYIEKQFDNIFNFDRVVINKIIFHCCEIKSEIVSRDEKETNGIRMILNFGHTTGHAIEVSTNYNRFTHGEAVILGMVTAIRIAYQKKYLSKKDYQRMLKLLSRFPVKNNIGDLTFDNIIDSMSSDKKIREKKIRFILPRKIGEVFISEKIDKEAIIEGVEFLKEIYS